RTKNGTFAATTCEDQPMYLKPKSYLTALCLSFIFTFAAPNSYAIEVVVSAAGDLAFSDNHTRAQRTPPELSPNSVWDHGDGVATFDELTRGVEHLFWESEINFVN